MPTYVYTCTCCKKLQDVIKPLALIDRAEVCDECHLVMQRTIQAPLVRGDYPGYTCPITGDWIEGRRAHQENLKKHGCRVQEPGEKEEFLRRRGQEEKEFDAKIEATTEEFVTNLPEPKRAQLYNELSAGADCAITRSTVTPN